MEERRRAHDRDRRVSAGAALDALRCGGSASPTSSATARFRAFRASTARSCCSRARECACATRPRDTRAAHAVRAADFSGDDAIECTLVAGPVPRLQRDVPARPCARERRGRARRRRGVRRRAVPARLSPRRARTNASCAGHAPLRLEAGHALLVDGPRRSATALPIAIRPLGAGRGRARRQRRMPMRLFAADALTPDGWRRDVAIDIEADGTIAQVEGDAPARRRGTRGRPAAAGHAEPALARVPARDRRAHGARERGRRQLLDVAAGDVRVPRPRSTPTRSRRSPRRRTSRC